MLGWPMARHFIVVGIVAVVGCFILLAAPNGKVPWRTASLKSITLWRMPVLTSQMFVQAFKVRTGTNKAQASKMCAPVLGCLPIFFLNGD